jgi:hypothetical protein
MRVAGALLVAAAAMAWAGPAPPAPAPSKVLRIPLRIGRGEAADAKSFEATLDRERARIVGVLTPQDPQMILLVLDLVGDLASIEAAKEAVSAELGKLPESTYVGLLRAQDGVSVLVDPTADRAEVMRAIENLTVSGRPGLLEGLEPVERLADSIAQKARVRVGVLYISDADVRDYREDFTNPVINSSDPHDLSRRFPEALIQEKISKLQTSFAAYRTPLHIVQLTYRGDRLNDAYANGLRQLAESMAGTLGLCRSRAEISEQIGAAFHAVASEYALLVALPGHAKNMVQVQISAGDLPLMYRARLMVKEK